MATTKRRINISLAKDLEDALFETAKRDGVPAATKAGDLLRLGLEIEEDILLERVASERYSTPSPRLSHKAVWNA